MSTVCTYSRLALEIVVRADKTNFSVHGGGVNNVVRRTSLSWLWTRLPSDIGPKAGRATGEEKGGRARQRHSDPLGVHANGSARLTMRLALFLFLTQHVKITPHLLSFDLLFHRGNFRKVCIPELLLAAEFGYQAEA